VRPAGARAFGAPAGGHRSFDVPDLDQRAALRDISDTLVSHLEAIENDVQL
jgi:hypothetical protein